MATPKHAYSEQIPHESGEKYPSRPDLGRKQTTTRPRRRSLVPHVSLVGVLVVQAIAVIGCLASIVISLDGHVKIAENADYRTILAYLLIFIIATLFAIFIAIDSLLNKNVAQLLALCIFNISMSVYGAVLPRQVDHTLLDQLPPDQVSDTLEHSIEWRLIVVPATTGLCSIILLGLTWHLHREFGWDMYRRMGADIQLRKALKIKYIFFMLQKFNLFFLIGFCIQTELFNSVNLDIENIILPAVALLASCFVILFASIGVEHERKWIMSLYYVVWVFAGGFLCYEIYRIYPHAVNNKNQRSFILFASLTLGMLLSTGICSIPCWLNFGKGLKEARLRSPWFGCLRRKRRTQSMDHSLSTGSLARPILD